MLILLATVIAVARQYGSDLPAGLKRLTVFSLAYLITLGVIGYFSTLSFYIDDPSVLSNQWALLKASAERSPLESPLWFAIYMTAIACSIVLGSIGLMSVQHIRGKRAEPPPISPIGTPLDDEPNE